MSEISEQIDTVLDNIHLNQYWQANKDWILVLLTKKDALVYIQLLLTDGTRYSVLKLIDKGNLKVKDELIINYTKKQVNLNHNFYSLVFNLYLKKLIHIDIFEEIRKWFRDNDKEFDDKILITEERALLKHIGMERKQNNKIYRKKTSYQNDFDNNYLTDEINKLEKIDRIELLMGNNLCKPIEKIIFIYDLTVFLNLKRDLYCKNQRLYSRIYESLDFLEGLNTINENEMGNFVNENPIKNPRDIISNIFYVTKNLLVSIPKPHGFFCYSEEERRVRKTFLEILKFEKLKNFELYFTCEDSLREIITKSLHFKYENKLDFKKIISLKNIESNSFINFLFNQKKQNLIFYYGNNPQIINDTNVYHYENLSELIRFCQNFNNIQNTFH